MKLFVDLESLQLIEGPGFRNPVTSLRFKRGDAARLEVAFLTNGTTPATIGNPASLELRFGVKPRNRYDVGYLVHTAVWTMPAPGSTSPVYESAPSFNTEELDAALNLGSSTATELSEVALMGEITWREGAGEPTSTRTFVVVVENDVNRGTEGVPESAEPPYPAPESLVTTQTLGDRAVRHDVLQALVSTQKSRARTNIDAAQTSHSHPMAGITGLNDELLVRPKVVNLVPGDPGQPLPAVYPILFHNGSDVWLLPAGASAESAIPLTSEQPPPGQIVMEWQITGGVVTSYPADQTLPAGDYAFDLAIVDLVPDITQDFNGLLLNLSSWSNSMYSNVSPGSAMNQFSFFSMPLQLYVSFNPLAPSGQTGTADLYIEGGSSVDISFVEGDPHSYRLILTFTPI